jgi:crotonobetainyl-CoA:carnitine CoA-transferase CaiB-like acyl-CoA transferase
MSNDSAPRGPLSGVRIVECSMLGPAAITTHLADLGADVIKVEPLSGDYIREMTWPIVEGVSLMHLHINRGKRSVALDLRQEEGRAVLLDLVREADAVVEAMRPGGLERRGVGYDVMKGVNPRIVFATISGFGATGPYAQMPSHGVAYDTWAGLVRPEVDEDGFCAIPEHPSMGIHAGPLFGALGILASIIRARETGEGVRFEVAQSDAAAAMDWLRSETWKAYERPEDEVTGNRADNYERRAPGTAGMRHGVRYQIYESSDGHILFQASEREFWKNFCVAVGREDLFERFPGARVADHAPGNRELQSELRTIFRERTTAAWVTFGDDHNTPIAPVNTPQTLAGDPQFAARLGWLPRERLGAEQLAFPVQFEQPLPVPEKAPTVGEHTVEVLGSLPGYDKERLDALRELGVVPDDVL